MNLNVTLDEKATKALKEYITNRKEHSGWGNYDLNMAVSQLIRLGTMAVDSDCWGHASACLTDDGEISLHG